VSEIISREEIARQADQAAMRYCRTGRMEANPFAPDTDAWKWFKVDFERYCLLHSSVEGADEGGS
jgi:hypothetical protein